jgi:hypothetical protein
MPSAESAAWAQDRWTRSLLRSSSRMERASYIDHDRRATFALRQKPC